MKNYDYFHRIAESIKREFPQLECWASNDLFMASENSITLDYYVSKDANATVTLYWGGDQPHKHKLELSDHTPDDVREFARRVIAYVDGKTKSS